MLFIPRVNIPGLVVIVEFPDRCQLLPGYFSLNSDVNPEQKELRKLRAKQCP